MSGAAATDFVDAAPALQFDGFGPPCKTLRSPSSNIPRVFVYGNSKSKFIYHQGR
jgi:hypothetical protein